MKGLLICILIVLIIDIICGIVTNILTKREEKYVRELLVLMNEEKDGNEHGKQIDDSGI